MWEALVLAAAFLIGWFAHAFARVDRSSPTQALEHPVRRTLVDRILGRPGVRLRDLEDGAGFARGTVQYHLAILERIGSVMAVRQSGETRFYPRQGGAEAATTLSALLAGRVVDFARHSVLRPGLCQKETAKELGLRPKTVRHYARALVRLGLLELRRDGFRTRYYPTPRLAALLPRVEELRGTRPPSPTTLNESLGDRK